MYGIEPRYNEPWCNKFFNIMNIFREPKRKIYLHITNYNVNMLNIQHITADKRWTDQQSANPYGKIVIVKIKRQPNFSVNSLLYVIDIGTIVFPQKSPDCVRNQSLTMMSFPLKFVISRMSIYVTNPPFNEQIWPAPSDFVKSRYHCINKALITGSYR